jgi:hypothetical protein
MTVPNQIADMHRAIGRMEGKLDSVLEERKAERERITEIEGRTRKVENRQHWYSGAGAVLGAILGAVGVHVKP